MNKLREEIARIIEPFYWRWLDVPGREHACAPGRQETLAKADRIIAAWNRRADPLVSENGSLREPAQATQVSSDPTANADEPRQADGAFVLTVTATADGHEIAIDHPMGSDAWIKARDAMAAAHAELARHLAKQEECPAKPAARHTETGHECGTCGHHWWGPLHEAPCPACQLEGGKA